MAAKYHILRMEMLGTPPVVHGGIILTYENPAQAQADLKILAHQMNEKLCVKAVIDDEWRERENRKFLTGEYRNLSWYAEGWWGSMQAHAIWRDHFAHASLEKPGFIAYTKNEEDGTKDKQTMLRPGAYLERYFNKVLNDHGISALRLIEGFMKMYGPIDVQFATTDKEVIEVYDLLHTCLYGKAWPKGIHPATLYLAGDLQVAYIGDLKAGKVSARSVVWPDKKLHSRIYGDIARMTQGLTRLGYKWGPPIGAKIRRVQMYPVKFDGGEVPANCFAAPYIDKRNQQGGGHLSVKDDGKYLIICAEGEARSHHAGEPNGYTGRYCPAEEEHPQFTCDNCDGEFRKVFEVFEEAHSEDDEPESRMWCTDCRARSTFHCGYSGHYYSNELDKVIVGEHHWLPYYADMYSAKCEGNGKLYPKGHLRTVHFPDGTKKTISDDYIRKIGAIFQSQLTNRIFFTSERAYYTGVDGDRFYCAKHELKNHTFQCVECEAHWLLDYRNQPHGDDRLFCPTCAPRIKGGAKKVAPKPTQSLGGAGGAGSAISKGNYYQQAQYVQWKDNF